MKDLKYFRGVVPVCPFPKERPRFDSRSKRTYTPIRTRQYEHILELELRRLLKNNDPLDGPIKAKLIFYLEKKKSIPKNRTYPHTKPDLDNLCKAFYDAAEKAGVFTNDSRVVIQHHEKKYEDEQGVKIEFEFVEIHS